MTDPYTIASASGLAAAVFVAGFCAAVLWDMYMYNINRREGEVG